MGNMNSMSDMPVTVDWSDETLSSRVTEKPYKYVTCRNWALFTGPDGYLWACTEYTETGMFDWPGSFNVGQAMYAEYEVFVPDSVVEFLTAAIDRLSGNRPVGGCIDGSDLNLPLELDSGR